MLVMYLRLGCQGESSALVGDQAFDLLHLCSQRMAVIGISSETLRADEPLATDT